MMPPTQLVSVVMPTCGRVAEMMRAAASILAQGGPHLELIIVENGHTSESDEALDRLCDQDRRVRAVRFPDPLGPAESRNRGMDIAEGEFLATCDDDDLWLPGTAQTMLEFLDAHRELGAASAWHEVHHVGQQQTSVYRGPLAYSRDAVLWANFPAISFMFLRRAAFRQEPRYDPAFPASEDWDFTIRCLRERPMRTAPEVLYQYRKHAGSRITGCPENHRLGRQAILDKHGSNMKSACRLYQEAVIDAMSQPWRTVAKRLTRHGFESFPAAGFAASILAIGAVTSLVGISRRDPGFPARVMSRLVDNRLARA